MAATVAMTPDAATAGVDVAVAQLDTTLDHRAPRAAEPSPRGREPRLGPVDRGRSGVHPLRRPRARRTPRARARTPPGRGRWARRRSSRSTCGTTRPPVHRCPELRPSPGRRHPARSIVDADAGRRRRPNAGCSRVTTARRGEGFVRRWARRRRSATESAVRRSDLVFHWMGSPGAACLAHGGAVGLEGAGVLLVGAGGVGKSSTSLVCVEAGFDYAADDYCLVSAEPRPSGAQPLRDGQG